MTQLVFGTKQQIQFASDSEFFEALGFLSKNDGTTSIHWEHNENQGAWGSEGRIHSYKNIANFPIYFSNAFSAGVGKIIHRINCNECIQYIVKNHRFQFGHNQNINAISLTIPTQYLVDFNRGQNF
ncbi:hypothetical protein EDL99_11175 [Ornithobacterium rhinotracheale]|uniref:hypothetical protein n=1 Tax=Ornithobacterium rhinotracheale TaxID=28251 RepID=UPI00129C4AAE|nr:hypothetical protein [Ornithobacterium rhinotracheale]MRJ09411.1 hypothetical protein [Ornithobacterium rhinotracheale]UOH77051.1 hypothetical protein MT996_07445 [Ornithobacterium rhinotracheale]